MSEHQYKKCTSSTCKDCGGFGEYNGGPCSPCGGTGRTYCGGCRAEGMDCWYESLSLCAVCGGLEGALLPWCPGVMLTPEQHDANYKHYCAETGPFAHPTLEKLQEARVFAERYFSEDVGSMPPERTGARRFYDAVHELWAWYVETHTCAICSQVCDWGGIVQPANVYVCNECTKNRIIP